MKAEIRLIYFKASGKYYAEALYCSNKLNCFEIFDEVEEMAKTRKLPGLVPGHSDYIIYIDTSDHPMGYPGLIIMDGIKSTIALEKVYPHHGA